MPARRHAVFRPLSVAAVERLTEDAVAVTFAVPPELTAAYAFLPGQHLTLRCPAVGDDVRRSYSICSRAPDGPLRVGVKRLPGGAFSSYAMDRLRPGDVVEVLTPAGGFTVPLHPESAKHYCAIAAGSGITPILSILATALAVEPGSRCTLVYLNRTAASVMFADELADLKDRYLSRLHVIHVLTQETQEAELLSGRLDGPRLERLLDTLVPPDAVQEWLLCGPAALVDTARAVLGGRGVDAARVHSELFHLGSQRVPEPRPHLAADPSGVRPARVTVLLDGRASTVELAPGSGPILDAALAARPELPYSCRNGMCGTCRARLVAGEVELDHNFALEQAELEAGFVLACQAYPRSEAVTLDFDA